MPNMSKWKKILLALDVDGVLMPGAEWTYAQAFARHFAGKYLSNLQPKWRENDWFDEPRRLAHTTPQEQWRRLSEVCGLQMSLDEFMKRWAQFSADLYGDAEPDPDFEPFAEKLGDKAAFAINTSAHSAGIEIVVKKFNVEFGEVVCADHPESQNSPKPDGHTWAWIADRMGFSYEKVILFEDSASNIAGALERMPSVRAIGFSQGDEDKSATLRNAGASIVVANFSELSTEMVYGLVR